MARAEKSPPPYLSFNSGIQNTERRWSRIVLSVRIVWPPHEVAQALRALPSGEALWTALEAQRELEEGVEAERSTGEDESIACIEEAVAKGHGETALLLCAWCAIPGHIGRLLEQHGVDACAMDADGRTALHLACCAGDEQSVGLLLQHGAKVNCWDRALKATPIHCAAFADSVACIDILIGAGANVNEGFFEGQTPLYYAVLINSIECVESLLEAGANPNIPQSFTEPPLHVAAVYGFSECLRVLLKGGADVKTLHVVSKETALHFAARDGNAECATLLLDAGADLMATNLKRQTPLHLASLAQSTDTLELLLKRGAEVNATDDLLRTPLHCAIVKGSCSTDCVRLLLAEGANVNRADTFGYTPLHLAALNEFSTCVGLLINVGADVMARTNGGVSALTFVIRRTPETMPCFIERLDSSVTLHDHDLGDADCELRLDFRTLLPPMDGGQVDDLCERRVESALLLGFIEVRMRHLLKHPLCETFLFLKWKRIRKYFLISLAFQLMFVAFDTAYTIALFSRPPVHAMNLTNTSSDALIKGESMEVCTGYVAIGYILFLLNIIFLVKEIFGLAHGWLKYIKNWENWLKLLIVLSVFICHGGGNYDYGEIKVFQHHVAAVGIVLAWAYLMVIIGRFPTFGVYVQMFTTVSINFSKFLFAYCCLLVGFGLALGVLLPNIPSFEYPYFSLLKSFVMMSGELEYEDIFFGDKYEILYPGTSHVLFLVFVILVTVILTNLLVGLAVSDIQGLQKTARLNRLVRQAELVAHIESVLFSHIFHKIFPSAFLKPYLRSALMVSSTPYNRFVHLRPNDPREKRVPRHLIDGAYNLVASRSGRKTKMGETGPGSRKDAYRTWAMQYSLRSRVYSDDDDDINEVGNLGSPNSVTEFLTSQVSLLAAEAEARESFAEEMRLQIENMRRSMELLTELVISQRSDENVSGKKVPRMRSAPTFVLRN